MILIAVALFAAVSYAVTQSGRGGANADKERAIVYASQIVQGATAIQQAVQRMVLTGTAPASLDFCSDGTTAGCSEGSDPDILCATGADCVYAPEGGGALPIEAPEGSQLSGVARLMRHSAAMTVEGIGTGATNIGGIVTNLTKEVCDQINQGLWKENTFSTNVTGVDFAAIGTGNILLNTAKCASCVGKPYGCYDFCLGGSCGVSNVYTYYHIFVEQ